MALVNRRAPNQRMIWPQGTFELKSRFCYSSIGAPGGIPTRDLAISNRQFCALNYRGILLLHHNTILLLAGGLKTKAENFYASVYSVAQSLVESGKIAEGKKDGKRSFIKKIKQPDFRQGERSG